MDNGWLAHLTNQRLWPFPTHFVCRTVEKSYDGDIVREVLRKSRTELRQRLPIETLPSSLASERIISEEEFQSVTVSGISRYNLRYYTQRTSSFRFCIAVATCLGSVLVEFLSLYVAGSIVA